MSKAGIDAFIGNTSEELAMANLASLPTIAVPLGIQPLKDAPNSTRRHPISLGIFGTPQTDAHVRTTMLLLLSIGSIGIMPEFSSDLAYET